MEISPLRQLRTGKLPKMVSWYDPRLLARIGVRTIISNVFGQYADQRLIQAVTDPADDKETIARYDFRDPNAEDPNKRITLDETGAYWIDYVADVGDVVDPERAGVVARHALVRLAGVGIAVVVAGNEVLVLGRVGDSLHETLVGVLAEHR